MDEQEQRLRRFSGRARKVYFALIALGVLALAYAFVTSRTGQTVIAVCCGVLVLLAVVGILSERGMRRG